MEADELKLLFEIFEDTPRQGPGSAETTRHALQLLPDSLRVERVLDVYAGALAGNDALVPRRLRIEHFSFAATKDIRRAAHQRRLALHPEHFATTPRERQGKVADAAIEIEHTVPALRRE